MASKVKSGFLFYVFLLIAFLACIVVVLVGMMVFLDMPVFGIEFFNEQGVVTHERVSTGQLDENNDPIMTDVKFSNLTEIRIEVTSAKVFLVSNGDYKSYIKISNNTFGFAWPDDRSEFETDIRVVDTVMTIKYKNPSGWVLTENTAIYLNAKQGKEGGFMTPADPGDNFDNVKLTFVSASGNLNIGGPDNIGKNEVGLKEINATTISGQVLFDKFSKVDYGSNAIKMVTDSGDFRITKNIKADSIYFESKSGKFTSRNSAWKNVKNTEYTYDIEVLNGVNLKTTTGVITLGNIKGFVSVDSTLGNISAGGVTGNFVIDEKVNGTNFTLGRVHGQFLLPDADSSNVSIGESLSTTSIKTKSGNVTVKKIHGATEITTLSGSIEVLVEDSEGASVTINTENGRVKADFNRIKGANKIISASSNVNVRFYQSIEFLLIIENVLPPTEIDFSWDNPSSNGTITDGVYKQTIGNGVDAANSLTVKGSKQLYTRLANKVIISL